MVEFVPDFFFSGASGVSLVESHDIYHRLRMLFLLLFGDSTRL
jgi:hypothetical protein